MGLISQAAIVAIVWNRGGGGRRGSAHLQARPQHELVLPLVHAHAASAQAQAALAHARSRCHAHQALPCPAR